MTYHRTNYTDLSGQKSPIHSAVVCFMCDDVATDIVWLADGEFICACDSHQNHPIYIKAKQLQSIVKEDYSSRPLEIFIFVLAAIVIGLVIMWIVG